MANEQDILNNIISQKAIDQLLRLEDELEKSQKLFVENIVAAEKLNSVIAKSKSLKDYSEATKQFADVMDRVKKAQNDLIALEDKMEKVRAKGAADFQRDVEKEIKARERKASKTQQLSDKERLAEIKLDQERKKRFDNYDKQLKKEAAAEDKRAQKIADNSRPYVLLSKTLEDQRKKAQDLGIIYGEQSEQFKNAAKEVIELDNRLKAIDATLGKHQRNVGNYKSAYNGLSNSFQQIARELPSMAVNANTFFLAISNNLPIFFDAIKQANDALKEARAAAIADAEAKGIAATATAIAGGASEEAAEQMGEFAKEQALAAAEAVKGPGIFKQLASSIFSLQTGLTLLVTLLTLYGAELFEFFKELIKGKESIDSAKISLETLNKAAASTEFSSAIKNVNELRINIDLAKQGFLSKEKVLKQYNESIGQTTGEVKTLDAAEKALVKNGNAYIRLTLLKAAAQIALEEAAKNAYEAEQARMKTSEDAASGFDKFAAAFTQRPGNPALGIPNSDAAYAKEVKMSGALRRKAEFDESIKNRDARLKIADNFQKQAAEIAKQYNFDFFGGDFEDNKDKKINTDSQDLIIQRVQFELDAQKTIAENEKLTLDERLDAARNYNDLSIRLAALQRDKELMAAELTASRRVAIQEKANNELDLANAEFAKMTEKIFQDTFDKEQKERLRRHQEELSEINEQEAYKLDILNSALAKQTITEEQFGQLRLDLQREYILKYIAAEIKQVEELLAITGLSVDQRAELEKKLAELKLKLSRTVTANQIEDNKNLTEAEKKRAKEREEIEKRLSEKKKELQREVFSLGVEVVNAGFENQQMKFDQEIEQSEKKKQLDIDNVQNSVASEQEKKDKIAAIEIRAEGQRQVLEQRKRQIAREQAKFEKAANLASITMSTYAAAAAALRPPPVGLGPVAGIPLAALTVGIGLARAAQVVATPLPAYKIGTSHSKAGLALTDEAGPELYIPPSGKAYIGSDQPNIKDLQAGTKIIPHHELVQMIAKPELLLSAGGTQVDLAPLIAEQRNGTNKLYKAIKEQKPAPKMSKQALYEANNQSIRLLEWQRRNL